jgi:hypothetical protein
MRWWQATTLCAALAAGSGVQAQERFSPFIASDPVSVEQMVVLAGLRDGDTVIDLGSGDGRIVIAAARAHAGIRGRGVDLDEKLVRESNAAAQAQGLAERVRFVRGDVFDADLSQADVIFIWLWPEIMRMLRPKILAEARPGTRVITGIWALGNWRPDRVDDKSMRLNLWIVPARIDGYWRWQLPVGGKPQTYSAVLDQQFQDVEGVVRAGNRRGSFTDIRLAGDDLSFTLDMTLEDAGRMRHEFRGRVQGEEITGTVRVVPVDKRGNEITNKTTNKGIVLPWRATRTATSSYFAPAGLVAH